MNILHHYVLTLLSTAFTFFILAIFIYFKDRKRKENWTFALFAIAAILWSFGEGMLVIAPNETSAIFWNRVCNIGIFFITTCNLHFILAFLDLEKKKKKILYAAYTFSFIALPLNFSEWFLPKPVPKFSLHYFIEPGTMYLVFVGIWLVIIGYGLFELFKAYTHFSGARRNQLMYLCWGTVIGYAGGCGNYLLTFDKQMYPYNPFGTYGVVVFGIMLAYAIVKHRLMDIHLVIRWSTVVSILAVLLTSLYVTGIAFATKYFNVDMTGIRVLVIGFLGATILVFHRTIKRIIENMVLMREKDEKEELDELYQNLATTLDLKEIKWIVISELESIFRTRCVTLVLFDLKDRRFKVYASVGYEEIEKVYVAKESPLVTWLMNNNRPAVYDWLDEEREKAVRDAMDSLNMEVAMVLAHNDTMVGFLGMSEKKRRRYTADEIILFAAFCEKMAVPFTNAVKHRLNAVPDEEDEQGEDLPSISVPPNLNEPGKPKIFFRGVEVKDDPKDPYSVCIGPLHAVNRKWDWIKMRDSYDPTMKEIRLYEEEKKDDGDDPAL